MPSSINASNGQLIGAALIITIYNSAVSGVGHLNKSSLICRKSEKFGGKCYPSFVICKIKFNGDLTPYFLVSETFIGFFGKFVFVLRNVV